jgi:hypothetical protein
MGLYNHIKWIKNIKRDSGNDWAYYDAVDEDEFNLAFSSDHAYGAEKPDRGDIIVLFQTIENLTVGSPGTYLTHLVEVISDVPVSTGRINYPTGRWVRVLARAEPRTSLRSDQINMNFQHVSSGQLCDIIHFNKAQTTLENKRRIIELMTPYF